jgi:hypothetical protein
VPRCSARSFWAPGDQKHHGDLRFRRPHVVGVPIAEVVNTLANWLRWMAGSYVGRLDTKTTSLRSACLNYLGLENTLVCLQPYQPSWAPWMRDLPRSVCSCSSASLLWTPRILCQE